MKNICTSLFIILTVSFSAKSQVINKDDFEKSKQQILTNLKSLEEEVISHLRHDDDRENAYYHIDEIKRILDELSINESAVVYPMEDARFMSLLESIDNEHFDSDRKKIISLSVADNYFLMSQLVLLLQKFTFDQDRLDVVEKIYPKVLDIENNSQLFKYFTFDSSKEKLEEIIKKYQGNPENK